MNERKIVTVCFFISILLIFAPNKAEGQTSPAARDPEEQRLNIVRFGTDTEIATLIRALRAERPSDSEEARRETPLDRELRAVADRTSNRAILTEIFGYFSEREMNGLEERALRAIQDRDYEAGETVNAAINYLGSIKARGILEVMKEIMDGEENRFLASAILALGQAAEQNNPAETAEYLVHYYTTRFPAGDNSRLIITALGDTRSREATAFLISIAENEDERVPLRMSALEGLAKIADPAGLPAIISAASSRDPNVRSTAVGALSPFSGDNADTAIIEGFRDSYYRTRIAAAKAAGERKLVTAIPFLRFRSENDEVPTVRDESVRALGLIGTREAETILNELFSERRNSDRVRILAAEMLLTHSATDYVNEIIVELDEAKSKNQNALYNGFLRILGNATSPRLEDLSRRFFASGGVIEKSYALDMSLNNNFRSLENEIRSLVEPRNSSLSRKSIALLERWGLPIEALPIETNEG